MQAPSPPPIPGSRPADPIARVLAFDKLPDDSEYWKCFRSLPRRETEAYTLGWNYPTPPAAFYERAFLSYTAQVLQRQTPYGTGSWRRSAPVPPPPGPPKPPLPAMEEEEGPCPTSSSRLLQDYPPVPDPAVDAEAASRALGSRLLGTPQRVTALLTYEPPPADNHDFFHLERLALYFVFQQDGSLRFNVDSGRFLRTYSGGETKEVLEMSQITQVLRLEQVDRWTRVAHLLQLLPHDLHLFGAPVPLPHPSPPPPTPVLPGIQPITVQMPPVPKIAAVTPPVRPAPAVTPSTAPVAASGPLPPAQSSPPATASASTSVPVEPAPVFTPLAPSAPSAPMLTLSLKAHRYWDLGAGSYSEVSQVRIGEELIENSDKLPTFSLTRQLPQGPAVPISVTWTNGQTRSWEQALTDLRGHEVELYSPQEG